MIPKIIHQIWVGLKPIPASVESFCRKIEEAHPEWTYMFWSNQNYPDNLPNNYAPIISRTREATAKGRNMGAIEADLLRYLILQRHGGVYLDCDFRLTGSLDMLDLQNDLILCAPYSKGHWVCNGFLAAKQDHPVLSDAVHNAVYKGQLYFGPLYFSNIFKRSKGLPENKTTQVDQMRSSLTAREQILEPEYFFGKSAKIASHIGLGSWLPRNHDTP